MLTRILSLYAYSESGAAADTEFPRRLADVEVRLHIEEQRDLHRVRAARSANRSSRTTYGLEGLIDVARRTSSVRN